MESDEHRIRRLLHELITEITTLNEPGHPQGLRSRELSLAITKLEEAEHWLHHATLVQQNNIRYQAS